MAISFKTTIYSHNVILGISVTNDMKPPKMCFKHGNFKTYFICLKNDENFNIFIT